MRRQTAKNQLFFWACSSAKLKLIAWPAGVDREEFTGDAAGRLRDQEGHGVALHPP